MNVRASEMDNNLIWLRGSFVTESEATVNILSGMAQFGLNAFEGIRCYHNSNTEKLYAFRLQDHLQRLAWSCKLIGLELPDPISKIKENFVKTIIKNKFKEDCAIRLTVFADDIGSWYSVDPVSYFIAPIQKPRTNVKNLGGKRACISSWSRISDNTMPPRAKIGANYINGRYAHLQAKYDGYDLPIFLNKSGGVSEGAGACLFLVKDRKLITPCTSSSILESITRDTIIRLASDLDMKVEERFVDRTELYLADEIFLCGTAAEITPVVKIDKYEVGSGHVGKAANKIIKEYHKLVSGDKKKYMDWLTEIVE